MQLFYERFTFSRQIDLQNFEEYKKQVHIKNKKSKKEEIIEKEFEALKMSLKLPTDSKHSRHSGLFQSYKLDKKLINEHPPKKKVELKSNRSISTSKSLGHPLAAKNAPINANGRAKIVCSILTISNTIRSFLINRLPYGISRSYDYLKNGTPPPIKYSYRHNGVFHEEVSPFCLLEPAKSNKTLNKAASFPAS